MVHFVYPNVKKKKFIGCGRFTSQEYSPGDKYNHIQVFETPNITEIMEAISIIIPKYFESNINVYEKKDIPSENYLGASSDLAYFLSLINCSLNLKIKINQDIWCTGSINKGSYIKQVIRGQFETKLEAFLSKSNPDRLFIVPIANIQGAKHVCKEKDVQVKLLKEVLNKNYDEIVTKKTILCLEGENLKDLVNWLFEDYDTEKERTIIKNKNFFNAFFSNKKYKKSILFFITIIFYLTYLIFFKEPFINPTFKLIHIKTDNKFYEITTEYTCIPFGDHIKIESNFYPNYSKYLLVIFGNGNVKIFSENYMDKYDWGWVIDPIKYSITFILLISKNKLEKKIQQDLINAFKSKHKGFKNIFYLKISNDASRAKGQITEAYEAIKDEISNDVSRARGPEQISIIDDIKFILWEQIDEILYKYKINYYSGQTISLCQ